MCSTYGAHGSPKHEIPQATISMLDLLVSPRWTGQVHDIFVASMLTLNKAASELDNIVRCVLGTTDEMPGLFVNAMIGRSRLL